MPRPIVAQRLTMNRQGRVVIPSAMRTAMGLGHGGQLLVEMEGTRLVLSTAAAAEERLFARWQKVRTSSAELIRSRRKEARRESKA